MASEKILAKKQEVIDEIKKTVQDASSIVLFAYRGLTDEESKELRRSLRNTNSDYKVYKNTLIAFGSDAVAPVKVLADFAKKHDALALKVGIVEGEVSDKAKLEELATIPSREGLLTMLAAGMMGIPKDLSICLDLYAKQKEEEK